MHADPRDTQLARLLFALGRVPAEDLTRHLDAVRTARASHPETSLAGALIHEGILSEGEATSFLQELQAWFETDSSGGSPDATRAPSGQAPDATRAPSGQALDATRAPSGRSRELSASGEGAGWRTGGRVGPYLLGQKIGQGGMGVVFEAQHQETGEMHALKGLDLEASEVLRRRFEREFEAQSRVDRHPNVVRVHGVGEGAGHRYLAMEFVGGGDLQQRLRNRRYGPSQAAHLVLDLARGLAHVHACGVLHRDLKPANVLFDAEGNPRLVDFGLAGVSSGSDLTKTGDMLGTPTYMAPEQALGDFSKVDERADVYALGTILYECLTGAPPFVEKTVLEVMSRVLTAPPRPPREIDPGIDPELEKICLAALEKDPERRIQSAASLANALANWTVSQAKPAPSRWSKPLGFGAALLLAAGAIGVLWERPEAAREVEPSPSVTPEVVVGARPWRVEAGQRFRAELYIRTENLSRLDLVDERLAMGEGNREFKELDLVLEAEVEQVVQRSARIRFRVREARSRVRLPGQESDLERNYVASWKGKGFVVEFDSRTGAPLEVRENHLPQESADEARLSKIFAELAQDRSLIRLCEGAFHFFPAGPTPVGETWVLGKEPSEALMRLLRVQIPAWAERVSPDFQIAYDGRNHRIALDESQRTVSVDPQGRYRWGVPGEDPLTPPKPPGRDVRGVATIEEGWIKEAVTDEVFWLEFPADFGGIARKVTLELHFRRGVRLSLLDAE